MNVQERLAVWSDIRAEVESHEHTMGVLAERLEKRAGELSGSSYARLVGVDRDGRIRFTVRGFGQHTFAVEELER